MPVRATAQDGTYPRPQLLRDTWTDLGGPWQFAFDDDRAGTAAHWHASTDLADRSVFDRDITVPYPPEAPRSGIGETGPHPVLWYRRVLRLADVAGAEGVFEHGHRLVLRFGAVDYRAQVWLDGALVGSHEGGQTPWAVDLTDALLAGALPGRTGTGGRPDPTAEHVLVVRSEDDPRDITQPRGKQDWQDEPHGIWYFRTSGIWQPVWLEVVPPLAVEHLAWVPDVPHAAVHLEVTLTAHPVEPVTLAVRLELDGTVLAEQSVRVTEQRARLSLAIPALANGQDEQRVLWAPEHPHLVDADVRVLGAGGAVLDEVSSYLGIRSAEVRAHAFYLNSRPVHLRSVLAQNYWPDSHLAAPDAGALRREVELVKELGFNAVRVHQKAEDPRFLHWCDRLGVLVWGETANAFAFSPEAVRRLTTEWMDLVHRDISHPSIVTWVPLNESWGIRHVATQAPQQHYATALAALTRALDPSRPVVSNDGWEHTDSDLWTVHDYAELGATLRQSYGSVEAVEALLRSPGPHGRRIVLPGAPDRQQPVMLTEFGGIRFTPPVDGAAPEAEVEAAEAGVQTWGYSTASDADDFAERLADILDAVHASPVLSGFCYTQLTDTLQEANGLLDALRRPKLPMDVLRAIVTGPPRPRP